MYLFIFVVLNVVNGLLWTSVGYGVNTWQYWISLLCVCGSYLAGVFKFIFKEN